MLDIPYLSEVSLHLSAAARLPANAVRTSVFSTPLTAFMMNGAFMDRTSYVEKLNCLRGMLDVVGNCKALMSRNMYCSAVGTERVCFLTHFEENIYAYGQQIDLENVTFLRLWEDKIFPTRHNLIQAWQLLNGFLNRFAKEDFGGPIIRELNYVDRNRVVITLEKRKMLNTPLVMMCVPTNPYKVGIYYDQFVCNQPTFAVHVGPKLVTDLYKKRCVPGIHKHKPDAEDTLFQGHDRTTLQTLVDMSFDADMNHQTANWSLLLDSSDSESDVSLEQPLPMIYDSDTD